MEKTGIRWFPFLIVFGLVSGYLPAPRAQTSTAGTIQGQVRNDATPPRGVPGATVILTNQRTGIRSKTSTLSDGSYIINTVQPGTYTITASCRGCNDLPDSSISDFVVRLSEHNLIEPPPLIVQSASLEQAPTIVQSRISPSFAMTEAEVERLAHSAAALGSRNLGGEQLWLLPSPGPHAPDDLILPDSPSLVSPRDTDTQPPSPKPAPAPSSPQSSGGGGGVPAPPAPESKYQQVVNTSNATRSGSFSERQLRALPLPGTRTFDDLVFLVPGVAPPPQTSSRAVGPGIGPGVGTSGQFAVNGLRSRANNFTVDGSDNNDEDIGVRRQGFTALLPQSIESVQEFYIATLLPTPQFGRNLGGQVNAVSQSGGSEYHGTLYGYLTDKLLKARDAFDLTGGPFNFPILRPRDGAAVLVDGRALEPVNPVEGKDKFTRAQYGMVFGGPIVKEKTLFFTSLEHQDINASKESHFAVPTVAERGFLGSGEGFPTFQLYPTSEVGDAFFSLFPFPNNPRGPYRENTFTQILPASAVGTIFSTRLDHQVKAFNRDHLLTGRYNFADDNTIIPTTGGALFSSQRALVRTQNLSLFANSIFSPQVMNEFRFSYGRTRLRFDEVERDPLLLPSKLLPNEKFLLNAPAFGNFTLPGAPPQYKRLCRGSGNETKGSYTPCAAAMANEQVGIEDILGGPLGQVIVSGFSPIGVDVFHFPQGRVNNTFQFADTFFYNLPRQRFTAGVDIRRIQLNSSLERNFRPLAVFNGVRDRSSNRFGPFRGQIPARANDTLVLGTDLAALGVPTGFFQTLAVARDSTIGLRYLENNLFLADQIRVRPNFTLTLGVRYELNTVPEDVNRHTEFDTSLPELQKFFALERIVPGGSGLSGLELFLAGRTKIYRLDNNNVAPHVAFAWDPLGDGKTSIRAGYGIYYDQIPGAVISQSRNLFPCFLTINSGGLAKQIIINGNTITVFQTFNPAGGRVQGTLNNYTIDSLRSTIPSLVLKQPFPVNDEVDYLVLLTGIAIAPFTGPTAGFIFPADDLVTPYSQHWGLTIEREIKSDFLLSAAYAGTRGVHLLRFATPNLGLNSLLRVDGVRQISTFQIALSGTGNPLRRRFPFLGSYTSIESDVNSTYHSLQLQLNKRFSHGIQFTTAYTWSHTIDEVSDIFDLAGARTLPQDSFNRRGERGDANFDVRHRFVYSAIWDLPFFEQHKLLGGWQLASIGTFQIGQPYSVLSSIDANEDGNLTDRVAPGATDPLRTGASRNTFRAPGIATVDLAVNKTFWLTTRQKLEFRSEFFNLFNRTHFGIPVNQLFFGGYGVRPATEKIFVDTRLPARTIQFALKYSF